MTTKRFPLSAILLILATSWTGAATATDLYFPGVASIDGYNGTRWRSSARITNPSSEVCEVSLSITPRDSSTANATRSWQLQAGATLAIEDLYAELGAAQGAGTLAVSGEVQTWVRTFNNDSASSFGMAIPGVGAGDLFVADEEMLFAITRPADLSAEPRSNLVLLNPGDQALALTLESGTSERIVIVAPNSSHQVNDIGAFLGLEPGSHLLRITAPAPWFGYVATIDPDSGDPTLQQGLEAGINEPVVLFLGVASNDGLNSTRWRSSAVIANPTDEPQEVQVLLAPRDEAEISAAWTDLLAPGEVRVLLDLYAALEAADGSGMIYVLGLVKTWVRTFNDDPDGTYGAALSRTGIYDLLEPGLVYAYAVSRPTTPESGPRSNLLLFNPQGEDIVVTLQMAGRQHAVIVPAGSNTFLGNVGELVQAPAGDHRLVVSANRAFAALVSTVDPLSGDPSSVPVCRPITPATVSSEHVEISDRISHYEVIIDYSSGASPTQVGTEYGRLVTEMVPNFEQLLDDHLYQEIGDELLYLLFLARAEHIKPQIDPAFRLEIEAIAAQLSGGTVNRLGDGKLSVDELYLINLIGDVAHTSRCSAISVFGERSATGGSLTARLVDEAGYLLPRVAALTVIITDSGGLVVNVGFLGYQGIATGVNHAGLMIGDMDSDTFTPYPNPPIGMRSGSLDMRHVLEHETTVAGAGAYLARADFLYPFNLAYMIADPQTGRVLENDMVSNGPRARTLRSDSSPLNAGVEWGISNAVAVVNSFVLEGNTDNHTGIDENVGRWQSIRSALAGKTEPVTLEDLREIASYHAGSALAPGSPGDVYNLGTQQIVLFDPVSGVLEVAFHPRNAFLPDRPRFERFTLEDR